MVGDILFLKARLFVPEKEWERSGTPFYGNTKSEKAEKDRNGQPEQLQKNGRKFPPLTIYKLLTNF